MTDQEMRKTYSFDTIESLAPTYFRVREEVEKKKRQRTLLLLGAFFVFYAQALYALVRPTELTGFGAVALISAILSLIHFYANLFLFMWMFTKNTEDSKRVEHLEKRLRFAEEREDPISARFRRGM